VDPIVYLRRHATIVGHGACDQGREGDRTPEALFHHFFHLH
jgi:hypothetical protein